MCQKTLCFMNLLFIFGITILPKILTVSPNSVPFGRPKTKKKILVPFLLTFFYPINFLMRIKHKKKKRKIGCITKKKKKKLSVQNEACESLCSCLYVFSTM